MSKESKKSKKDKKKKDVKPEVKESEPKDIAEIKEEPSEEEKKPVEEEKPEKFEKPVVIRAEAYKTIILYASRYANQAIPPKDWKEIYGILIGTADDDFVYVESAEALTYGHSTDVQLEPRHYIFIDAIQQKLDDEKKGHYMVGWFHSHPGLSLFFSYIDLLNQLGFQQNNSDFCGLVFDHTLLGKKKEEKIKGEDGVEHSITKFDTGFEIYRLTDVSMDINAPNYDNNYHKVDYIVDGLNKFFFANVLTELSALVSAGKPLQSAYGEEAHLESSYQDATEVMDQHLEKKSETDDTHKEVLVEIPESGDMAFDVDDFFYDEADKKTAKKAQKKETAEQLIYEGNQAFENKDAFTGIEKYRKGIEIYKDFNDYNRVLDLLRALSERCISTEHLVFAEEFSEKLFKLADKQKNLFYKAEGNYLIGYLLLKKAKDDSLEYQLKIIQDSSIDYEKAGDHAGAGRSYYKIGTIYQSRLNKPFNAALFYVQAIKSYNEALVKSHPLRTSLWSKAELLSQKITELKDIVQELIPHIENEDEKNKVKSDLNSIQFNL